MNDFELKCQKLTNLIEKYTKNDIVVAFSGGVDSSLLLKIACESAKIHKKKVYAVTLYTTLHTVKELDFTVENAEKMGAIHKIIEIDVLKDAEIENNPKDRCYLCKKYMFSKVTEYAKTIGADVVIEGTNADDLTVYRPGIKAVRELGILSPLADVGMTKAEVRTFAAQYNITASEKPSTPCLATRFEYGAKLDYDKIRIVEQAEEYIRSLGFYNVRLRVHGSIARIEVDVQDMPLLMNKKEDVIRFVKKLGFKYITLDLEGFTSGSMDR
ncbi:MAG: ATP-dependent sacrificial sulfur transferase LarE [Clostridia bacterium]|nr:ATP-dependent sacrificial sulfur transferase LarE [Clostridia bacterium]